MTPWYVPRVGQADGADVVHDAYNISVSLCLAYTYMPEFTMDFGRYVTRKRG